MIDYGNNNLKIAKYLETYSLEEIFEINNVTEEDVLEFLVTQEYINLPEVKPVDLDE